jgi:serine phosphatase RsbU (regulator of sigma subunit)
VAELQEEFARRLGAADRTIAQLADDKERLRAQLALASQGSGASESRLAEKTEYIAQLQ